jgi:crotonobetainyl-CoA:carnitine CoA-transferase CaiB-like acyl-CoA transferase
MAGPLEGLRVIDMTGVLMGPYATTLLGDMGADVIKVEAPEGDTTRRIGPARNAGMSSLFIQLNRSKRSLVLDLKQPEGRAALLRLCESADVLMFNLRPHTMKKLGLTYEEVSAVNPKIVYCGVYGFGNRGRYAGKPAYDDLIQGAVALPTLHAMSGGQPRYMPITIADRNTGLTAVHSVLAALFHRERSGRGQSIEVPMFEMMASYVLGDHLYGKTFDPPIGGMGYPRLLTADRRPYKTRDGYVCALIYNDKQWRSFLDLVGKPEMMELDAYRSLTARIQNVEKVYGFVAEMIAGETTVYWLEELEKADVPVMPLHTLDSLLEDPHLADVGLIQEYDHPSEGRIRGIASPTVWSDTQPEPERLAPRLGEHSREILTEAGYSPAEIDALFATGATV